MLDMFSGLDFFLFQEGTRGGNRAAHCALILLVLSTFCGCAPHTREVIKPVAVFPPQEVVDSNDFEKFRQANEEALKVCEQNGDCDTVLFNLGFLYVYPPSPFYDQNKGLKLYDELIQKYPSSPLAYHARLLTAIMRKSPAGAEKKKEVKQLKGKLKSKDTTIKKLREEVERSREQIERSREIDLEVDRKERELLQ